MAACYFHELDHSSKACIDMDDEFAFGLLKGPI